MVAFHLKQRLPPTAPYSIVWNPVSPRKLLVQLPTLAELQEERQQ